MLTELTISVGRLLSVHNLLCHLMSPHWCRWGADAWGAGYIFTVKENINSFNIRNCVVNFITSWTSTKSDG